MVDNCWYIDDQKSCALQPSHRFVIADRERFIIGVISEYYRTHYSQKLSILDAGCGDGVFLEKIANKIKDALIYGIDYNPVRVERAVSLLKDKENVNVASGDVSNLSFCDEFFDVILLNQVLEHIPDDEKTLRELYRVLKSGGVLIVGVPNEGCFLARIRNNFLQKEIRKTTDHIHFYTEKKIAGLIDSVGFRRVAIWRQSFFLPHLLLNALISRFTVGYKFLGFLGQYILPSQCAGLYLVCKK